jgi:putative acetyltransferase
MNHSNAVTIEAAPRATEEVRSLIGELDSVLSAEYTPEQQHGLTLDAIFQPHVRFFLARLRGVAVGCGKAWPCSPTLPRSSACTCEILHGDRV